MITLLKLRKDQKIRDVPQAVAMLNDNVSTKEAVDFLEKNKSIGMTH